VTRWNDPRIRALNPGVHLPGVGITPLYSNASGDTYVFSSYLSRVSPAWRTRIGDGSTVSFPTGVSVSDTPGLVAQLEATNGAIAYVGASYLIAHRLPAAALRNAAGNFVYPNLANIISAGRSVTSVPVSGVVTIVDPPSSARIAYPISTFGYIVVSSRSGAARKSALAQWILYTLSAGKIFGQALDFAPVPRIVVNADRAAVRRFGSGG
jgi:phosphate transport system substrate-binding protein